MSRIGDLIAEHCPQGVEFRPLKEIGTWYGGGTPSKQNAAFWVEGTIPWLSPKDMRRAIVDSTEDYITEAAVNGSATKIVPANSVALVVRSSILDHTLPTALIPVPITLNQDMKAVVPNASVLPEYLAHLLRSLGPVLLRTVRKSGGSVPSLEYPKLLAHKIPVPPLAIQREIASILDKMESLRAELEAELEYRSRQYAFYRDQLLTFREAGGVRWIPMGDLGSIFGGLTGKSKSDFSNGNARFVSYVNVFNNLAVNLVAEDFVRVRADERQRSLQKGDVLFTGSSESAAEVAMSAVVTTDPDGPLYLNSFSIGFRLHDPQDLHPDFAKHLFRSTSMRASLVRTASGVTRFNVSKARLAQVVVPIPPVEEQRRIANLLDKLDALVSDLTVGLPAEIAMRRQQYEYYRNKLLTFEEVA